MRPCLGRADRRRQRAAAGDTGRHRELRAARPSRLTSRGDLSGLTVDDALSGALSAGTAITALHGTGRPGAEVRVTGGLRTAASPANAASALAEPTAAAVAADRVVVGADGTWNYAFERALEPGAYSYAVAQAFGTREADPVTVAFSIVAAATDPGTSLPDVEDGEGGGSVTADGSSDSADDALASTGSTILPGGIAPLLALLSGAAAVLIGRRHRLRSAGVGQD